MKSMKLSMLEPVELDAIHQASLDILKSTGIKFCLPEVLDLFKHHGFTIKENKVFFTPRQVENAIKQVPESFRFSGRNSDRSVLVGDMKVKLQPTMGCIYVLDPNGHRRKGTNADYIKYQQLVQYFDTIAIGGAIPIVPGDIPVQNRNMAMMQAVLKYTDKPIIGWTADKRESHLMLDLVDMALEDQGGLDCNHAVATGINPLSPLCFGEETLENIMAYAQRKQPVIVTDAAMAGITAPQSLIGASLQQTVECLACTVLCQLIQPGLPMIWAPASTVGYMKRASFCTGAPENMLINMITNQMAREYYNIPTRTLTGHTEAKIIDYQAGVETLQSQLISVLGGAEILSMPLGSLDSYMTISFEKMLLDEETIRRVLCIQKGVDFSQLDEAVKAIKEIGSEGSYLTHPTTLARFRQSWIPDYSEWDSYEGWEKKGSPNLIAKSGEKLSRIMEQINTPEMDPEIDKRISEFVQNHIR